MKRITITMTDEVWADLKNHAMIRGLVQASHGPSDAFMAKLVESIGKGLEEKHFFYLPKPDGKTT